MSSLAYVSHDGAVCTTGLEEAGGTAISPPGASFSWPTWSPDGTRLVASGFRSGSNGHGALGLYLLNLEGAEPHVVFANEPGTDAIAWRHTPLQPVVPRQQHAGPDSPVARKRARPLRP